MLGKISNTVVKLVKKWWWLLLLPLLFLLRRKTADSTKTGIITERIWEAMAQYGTDENTIIESCEELTTSELKDVYNKFGMRYYNKQLGINSGFLFGKEHDLFTWFKYELGDRYLIKLRAIWLKTGMNVNF